MINLSGMMAAPPILSFTPVPGARPAYGTIGFSTASGTLNQTTSPTLPSGLADGDLLVIAGMVRNDAGDGTCVVNTIGWNAFPSNMYGTSRVRFGMFWKIATAAESSSAVSLTFTGTTGNGLIRPRVVKFTAANGFHATPIGSISVLSGTASPADHNAIVADDDNQLALCIIGFASNVTAFGAWTGGTGVWTENHISGSISGGTGGLGIQTAPMSNGNSFDDAAKAFTPDAAWTSVAMRIRPAMV